MIYDGASLLEGSDESSDGYYTVPWRAHIGITVNRDTGISPCMGPAYGGVSPLSDIHYGRSEDGDMEI